MDDHDRHRLFSFISHGKLSMTNLAQLLPLSFSMTVLTVIEAAATRFYIPSLRQAKSCTYIIGDSVRKRATDGVSVTLDIGRAWRQAMARTGLRSH